MAELSRRALLAAAGSALLAGCSGDDDSLTVTPYDATVTTRARDSAGPTFTVAGPDPLGTAAVPAGARALPTPVRERVVDTNPTRNPVGVVADGSDLQIIANTRTAMGVQPAGQITLDAAGDVTDRAALEGLPRPRVRLFGTVGDTLVVGGHTGDPIRTWLRGYRDGTLVYRYATPSGVPRRFDALGPLGGDVVAAGTTDGRDRSVVARLGTDGSARWARTRYTTEDRTVRALASTPSGILLGGVSGGRAWLSGLNERGVEQWSRTPVGGARTYAVRDIASGTTGTYALVSTDPFESPPDHILLIALEGERIRWIRAFDPERRGATLRGGAVVDADGPVLAADAATESAAWVASLAPDGGVRWAGRYRIDDGPTRPIGLASLGDAVVAYGRVPTNRTPERSNVWLAWFSR